MVTDRQLDLTDGIPGNLSLFFLHPAFDGLWGFSIRFYNEKGLYDGCFPESEQDRFRVVTVGILERYQTGMSTERKYLVQLKSRASCFAFETSACPFHSSLYDECVCR